MSTLPVVLIGLVLVVGLLILRLPVIAFVVILYVCLVFFFLLLYLSIVRELRQILKIPIVTWLVFNSYLCVGLLMVLAGGFSVPILLLGFGYVLLVGFVTNVVISFVTWVSLLLIFSWALSTGGILWQWITNNWLMAVAFYFGPLVMLGLYHAGLKVFRVRARVYYFIHHRINQIATSEAVEYSKFSEAVIVVNSRLRVLSLNYQARRLLNVEMRDVISRSIFNVLDLVDDERGRVDYENALKIDRIRSDGQPQVVEKLNWYTGLPNVMLVVCLDIRPVADKDGQIEQMIFTLRPYSKLKSEPSYVNRVNNVLVRQEELFTSLKTDIVAHGSDTSKKNIVRLSKINQDLLLAVIVDNELTGEPFEFANLIEEVTEARKMVRGLASTFGVETSFDYSEYKQESYRLKTTQGLDITIDPQFQQSAVVLTQVKWLKLLLQKLVDIAVLLSIKQSVAKVDIKLMMHETFLELKVKTGFRPLSDKEKQSLFVQGYSHLGKVSFLNWGSGVEGHIIKKLIDHLGYELQIEDLGEPKSQTTGFNLKIWRNPS